MSLAPAGGGGLGGRMGTRLVGVAGPASAPRSRSGAIFAIGWTPCIGAILGGDPDDGRHERRTRGELQGALLLVGYTLGLGIPFVLIAAFYDRSRPLTRALVKHGRIVSLVGGLLVVAIGLAMMFDWLVLLPRYFQFVSAV